MVRVTAAELQSNFPKYWEEALKGPVSVTTGGEDSVVLVSSEVFNRLKSFDTRQAFYAWELPDEVDEALAKAALELEGAEFNHEMKP